MRSLSPDRDTTTRRPARQVWHICRYRQRFEMPDQYRRQMNGPLDYARDFVGSNAGMEAAKYQQQIGLLGEGRQATLRFGLFRQLVGLASNQDRPYRGYLLDANCRSLGDAMLARLLKWELGELRKDMKALVAAGLIERVAEPNYVEQDQADLPPEGESSGKESPKRGSARKCAAVRASSKERGKRKPKQEKKKEIRNPQEEPKSCAQAQGESEPVTPGAPARGNPEESREPESSPKESEGEGAVCAGARRPPPSVSIGEAMRLGKIPIWWSDPACKAFSYAVFRELRLPMDPEGQEGKSQRGTFAAWLFEARARTTAAEWGWLEEKALAKAREIARYGKAARRPGAVWLKVMQAVLQARAGPGAACESMDGTRGNTPG